MSKPSCHTAQPHPGGTPYRSCHLKVSVDPYGRHRIFHFIRTPDTVKHQTPENNISPGACKSHVVLTQGKPDTSWFVTIPTPLTGEACSYYSINIEIRAFISPRQNQASTGAPEPSRTLRTRVSLESIADHHHCRFHLPPFRASWMVARRPCLLARGRRGAP